MDSKHPSTSDLIKLKQQLRAFTSLPTIKVYRMMASLYRATISPKQLVDSEITKGIARIALKNFNDFPDDHKRQKSIRIAKKLIIKWKEMLGYQLQQPIKKNVIEDTDESGEQPQKKVKSEEENHPEIHKDNHKDNHKEHEKPTPQKVERQPQRPPERARLQKRSEQKVTKTEEKVDEQPEKALLDPPTQDIRKKAVQGLQKYLSKYKADLDPKFLNELENQIFLQASTDGEKYKNDIKTLVRQIDQKPDFREQIFSGANNLKELITNILS